MTSRNDTGQLAENQRDRRARSWIPALYRSARISWMAWIPLAVSDLVVVVF
jgi:hypothetical protein